MSAGAGCWARHSGSVPTQAARGGNRRATRESPSRTGAVPARDHDGDVADPGQRGKGHGKFRQAASEYSWRPVRRP
jgi:hypothetical protein